MQTDMKTMKLILIAAVVLMTCNSMVAQDTTTVQKPAVWTLKNCIDYAKQQNITIQKNKVSAAEAQIDVKKAKAARQPSLSFSTNQGLTNRPFQETSSVVNGSQVVTSNNKNSYTGNYGFNASMTIYDGGQMNKNIELQKLNSQIADLNVSTSEMSIEESITKMYVQILYSMETVKQDSDLYKLSLAELDRAKALFKAGTLNKADVAQLESQTATDKYQIVADQSTLDNYKLQLKQLLELNGDENMTIAVPSLDDNVLEPLPTKSDVYAAALSLRPEIQAQKLSMNRSDLNVKIAKAGMLPTISLSAGTSTLNMSNNGNLFTQLKNQWNNTIGVTVSVPIFDRRQTKSNVEKAQLEQKNSYLDLLDTQKTLWKTIEGYWQDATSAQQRYVAAKEKTNYARTSYNLTSEQFKLGLKNIIELMTDKNTLNSSTQQMLQAKYMAILNRSLLKYYSGETISL
jgi:outer membrane protein